jgi:hypothetical protein
MGKVERFDKKIRELIKKARDMEEGSVRGALKLLEQARTDVIAQIAQTEWQQYRQSELKKEIDLTMRDLADKLGAHLKQAQGDMWEHGIKMTDLALQQVEIYLGIPFLDTRMLLIMQDYSLDLLTGLTRDASRKIGLEITRGLMGQKTPYEVIQTIGNMKDKDGVLLSISRRAETIVRTEAGRALEAAAQARREQAAQVVPGLKKQWRHGSSRVARTAHRDIDGQIRDIDKPFDIPATDKAPAAKLMYPRDPAGSAAQTVNCSCYTVPWKEDWGEKERQHENKKRSPENERAELIVE